MKTKTYPRQKNQLNQLPETSYPQEFLVRYDWVQTQVQLEGLHIPIMTKEILFHFWEGHPNFEKELFYFDGTFGRGGHYCFMKCFYPNLKAYVFDQDFDAISYAREKFADDVSLQGLQLFHQSFHKFSEVALPKFDFMLLDLGVSSPQLDEAGRGFSFLQEGPLDMRMDRTQEITAGDLLQVLTEDQLIDIFQRYGEIRKPFRVVKAIVNDRKEKKFESTLEFAKMIERIDKWQIRGYHPATQYFMALRLYLNREIEGLEVSLPKIMDGLGDEGRLQVLTFHSLEDRIVKSLFKDSILGETNKKIIAPSEAEVERNPRSRSAKLRIFRKTSSEKEFTNDGNSHHGKRNNKYPKNI